MVLERAELGYENWDETYGCEALTVGLETAKPKVFLRQGLTYEPRVRFTLAHELGHLVIPWHTGVQGCSPSPSAMIGYEQEQQANVFAGGILLPLTTVREALREQGLKPALEYLSAAGMSASAYAISLSRYLLPGFLLVSERGGGQPLKIWTKGSAGLRIDSKSDAETRALEHGSVELAGKSVFWYRFVHEHWLPADEDPRDTSDILWAAVELAGAEIDAAALYKSINGIIGGKLSTPRAKSTEAIYATLVHITENDRRIPPKVRSSPEFESYLLRKAHERSAKLLG